MSYLYTVVGGQFGSEAKGHVAAQLAQREVSLGQTVVAVRVAGPNAGHTAYDANGRPFALRTIPAMAVVDPDVQLIIAPGSEIDPEVLKHEIILLESHGHKVLHRLYIDAQATLLEPHHIEAEGAATMHERLGSTGKGIGAARADRLLRKATIWGDTEHSKWGIVDDTAKRLHSLLYHDDVSVIIEGTQGYGLGLHAGFYPYCTSSDCRSIDFLAMAGIDPHHPGIEHYEAFVVCRTFPIRVAGNSGPLHDETTWEKLSEMTNGYIQPERTTVTKKIRRVGGWDPKLVRAAADANGGRRVARIALSFLDYIDPRIAGVTKAEDLSEEAWEFIRRAERSTGCAVSIATTGPNTAIWLS